MQLLYNDKNHCFLVFFKFGCGNFQQPFLATVLYYMYSTLFDRPDLQYILVKGRVKPLLLVQLEVPFGDFSSFCRDTKIWNQLPVTLTKESQLPFVYVISPWKMRKIQNFKGKVPLMGPEEKIVLTKSLKTKFHPNLPFTMLGKKSFYSLAVNVSNPRFTVQNILFFAENSWRYSKMK